MEVGWYLELCRNEGPFRAYNWLVNDGLVANQRTTDKEEGPRQGPRGMVSVLTFRSFFCVAFICVIQCKSVLNRIWGPRGDLCYAKMAFEDIRLGIFCVALKYFILIRVWSDMLEGNRFTAGETSNHHSAHFPFNFSKSNLPIATFNATIAQLKRILRLPFSSVWYTELFHFSFIFANSSFSFRQSVIN